jgi:type IV secretory pathway TrbL component
MKKLILAGALVLVATGALAQSRGLYGSSGSSYGGTGFGSNSQSHTISPYTNSHGGYVGGSHATNPNNTQMDNYSTRGNVNPYTGAVGTRTPRY